MKIFTNKNVIQKIVIAILIVMSFNFITPTVSRADLGGILLSPITSLTTFATDVIIAALQKFMYGGSVLESVMQDADDFGKILKENPELKYDNSKGSAKYKIYTDDLDGDYEIPVIKYTPDRIFAGKIPSLDINFINPKYTKTSSGSYPKFSDTDRDGLDDKTGASSQEELNDMIDKSVTGALHETIAAWYIALRNLAIVGLLSVLVYVGIRMLISSTASDKAKYKQMIMDWVVALCLLFFLHYIMYFTLTVVEMITEGIGENNKIAITIIDGDKSSTKTATDSSGNEIKFNTDLMGFCRFQNQYSDLQPEVMYLIMYIALAVYTIVFTWKYVKRTITMAFLTLMAPVVALTYPIDKLNDGKAQAFNMWLKEYIFNALLQPFHLIVYTIFVGSSMNIAVENPIFAILFLAFIGPAEKLLRKFFGFDKSSTVGALDSAGKMFGGAAAYKLLSNAINKGKAGKGDKSGGNKGIRQQNPVEDPNAPSGVDGYTAPELASGNNETVEPSDEAEALFEAQWGNGDGGWDGNANANASPSTEDNANALAIRQAEQQVEQQANQLEEAEEEEEERRIDAIKRGLKNKASSIYNDKLTNKRWWGRQGIKAAKFAGRTAVRTVTGATLGAVGLGMGIAGDDLEDVLKYGAAGATLGATAGGNLALKGIDAIEKQGEDIWYGSHEEAQLAQQRRDNINSSEFRDSVQSNYQPDGEALSGEELEVAVERAADYYNNGITNNKQISKAMKLEDKIMQDISTQDNGWTEEQAREFAKTRATTVSKLAETLDNNYLRDPKKVDNLKKSLVKSIMNASNMNENDAGRNADQMIKDIKKLKKVD